MTPEECDHEEGFEVCTRCCDCAECVEIRNEENNEDGC
jgi:hypothetical protein